MKKRLYPNQQGLAAEHDNSEYYLLEAEVLDCMQLRRWLLSQGASLQ
ncbi:hypothetical protein [Denitrificimonas caeni]|nr:hypothetical protein [Denitrificimonas caeni]